MLAPVPRGVCTELRGSSSTNNTCLPCPRPSKDRKYENNTHSSVCIFYTRFPRANTRTIIQIQSSQWYWLITSLQTGICTYGHSSPIGLYCRVRREHLLDLFCVTVDITTSAVMQIQIVFIVCQIQHPAHSYNLYCEAQARVRQGWSRVGQ